MKHLITKHQKSGKCELYSKHIEFNPDVCECKFCPKSKTHRKNIHLLYKHLETKHKSEMSNKTPLDFQENNKDQNHNEIERTDVINLNDKKDSTKRLNNDLEKPKH